MGGRVAFSYAVAAYVLYLVVALSSPWLLPRGLRLDDDDAVGATGAVPLAQQPTGAGAAGISGSSATLGSPFLNWTLAASSSLRAGGDAAPPVDPVTWFAAATALHGAAAGRASRAEGDTLASAEAKQLAAVCASPLLLEAELEGGWRGLVAVDPNGCFSRLDKAGAVDVGRWVSHTPLRPRETFGSLAARGQQQQRRRLRQAGVPLTPSCHTEEGGAEWPAVARSSGAVGIAGRLRIEFRWSQYESFAATFVSVSDAVGGGYRLTVRGRMGGARPALQCGFHGSWHADTPLLVVAALSSKGNQRRYGEDAGWLKAQRVLPAVLCEKGAEAAGGPCGVERDVGREASSYLSFIVRNYHRLPRSVAFVHGQRCTWHQRWDVWDAIRAARPADEAGGYVPLNGLSEESRGDALAFAGLAPVWEALVRPWLPGRPEAPRRILHDCCAQFIASRAAITALPRATYRRLLDYVTGARRWPGDERWRDAKNVSFAPGASSGPSFFLESTWHILMGQGACHAYALPDKFARLPAMARFSESNTCDQVNTPVTPAVIAAKEDPLLYPLAWREGAARQAQADQAAAIKLLDAGSAEELAARLMRDAGRAGGVERVARAARAALEMAVLAAAKADGKPVELLEMGGGSMAAARERADRLEGLLRLTLSSDAASSTQVAELAAMLRLVPNVGNVFADAVVEIGRSLPEGRRQRRRLTGGRSSSAGGGRGAQPQALEDPSCVAWLEQKRLAVSQREP